MNKAIIIKASEPLRYEVKNLEEPLLKSLQNIVGGYIECVHPTSLPFPYVMIVDEEGMLKEDYEVNLVPSVIYGGPIAGTAVFMRDVLNENFESDIGGLDCAMIDAFVDFLHENHIMIKAGGEQ